MLSTNYGALVPEDELLTHQIVDTFATVSQSDPSWTEKIWTIAHARDNSLQVVLGIGKYTNRGVFDGAAGVCRGTEQWTVRAGDGLSSDAGEHRGRADSLSGRRTVACDPGEPRCNRARPDRIRRRDARQLRRALEDPWPDRSPDGYRVTHNMLRYHQIGVASGWVRCEGSRTEIRPTMDFDPRPFLGPATGRRQADTRIAARGRKIKQMFMTWLPMTLTRPDGSSLFVVRHVPGRTRRRISEIRCQAEQQNDRRHFAPVRVGRTGHALSGRQPPVHARNDHADRHRRAKRPLTVTAAGPPASTSAPPAITAGTTGCWASGSAS